MKSGFWTQVSTWFEGHTICMDKVLRRKTPAAHKWQTSCNSEINIKKNVPWHILAPRAVACDNLHLRASAHLWHVSAFLCNRAFLGISCYIKKPHSQWEQGENNAFNHLLLHTDIWVPFNGGITGYTYFPKAVPLSGFSFQLRSDLPFTKKHRASIVPGSLWLSACEPTVSVMAFFYGLSECNHRICS